MKTKQSFPGPGGSKNPQNKNKLPPSLGEKKPLPPRRPEPGTEPGPGPAEGTSPPARDTLNLYLQQMARHPVLTKEEELKISRQFFKTRSPELAQALARANLRFVIKIAAEYTRFGAHLMDLIQEGNMGLLQAIQEFNPYKGVRLITYAVWWIRGYIQEYLMRQHSLVRVGTNAKQRKLFYLLQKQQKSLPSGSSEAVKLLTSKTSHFKPRDIQSMKQRLRLRDVSLHQPVSHNKEGGGAVLLDLQSDTSSSQEEELTDFQEQTWVRKGIEKLKPHLSKKELFILNGRLLATKPLTLQEIGRRFSISREAVRQTEARLMKKIKNSLSTPRPPNHPSGKSVQKES